MSDQQVDIDAMIKSDRRRKFNERQRYRQQRRNYQTQHRDSRRDYDERDRSRDYRRSERQQRRQKPRRQQYRQRNQQLVVESYAISAKGFVSDVSLDDILKLAKGKKIINIKAFFQRQDGQPLQAERDTGMNVIINFVNKQQADDFIKQYSQKKLDGKNALQFQFRRGIVSRRPRQQQESGDEKKERKKKRYVQKKPSQNDKGNKVEQQSDGGQK